MASGIESGADPRQDILASLNAIVDISERWSTLLRRRQKRVRLAKAVLTGMLVWIGLSAPLAALIMIGYAQAWFAENRGLTPVLFSSIALAGIISGGSSYLFLKRSQDPRMAELSSLVQQMKRDGGNQGITENALLLAERVLALLPDITRKRNQDSLLFGMVAFVAALVVGGPPTAIIVGVLVWLYFRYETNRTYDKEISKFEEQRLLFEQRKKELLETL